MNYLKELTYSAMQYTIPPQNLVQEKLAEQIQPVLETACYNAAVEVGPYALKELIKQVDTIVQSLENNVDEKYALLVNDIISKEVKNYISAELLAISNILMQDNGVVGDMALKISSYACHRFALKHEIPEKVSKLLSDSLRPAEGESSSQKPNAVQEKVASLAAESMVSVFVAHLESFGESYQIEDITKERNGCGVMIYKGADIVMNCVSPYLDLS